MQPHAKLMGAALDAVGDGRLQGVAERDDRLVGALAGVLVGPVVFLDHRWPLITAVSRPWTITSSRTSLGSPSRRKDQFSVPSASFRRWITLAPSRYAAPSFCLI